VLRVLFGDELRADLELPKIDDLLEVAPSELFVELQHDSSYGGDDDAI
jgi:hypothetical protein